MSANYPSDPDAERAVLSCALQWPDCYDKVAAHSSGADLFYLPHHRLIWSAMLSAKLSAGGLDLVTLTSSLRASDDLDAVGGAVMLSELLSDVPSPKMLAGYLKTAENASKRRRIARECHSLAADACDMGKDVDGLVQRADSIIQGLLRSSSQSRARRWNDVLGKTLQQIDDARSAGGRIPGLSTGYPCLDSATNGYQPGQLWVVAARPGAGKTALLMCMVRHLVEADHATAIFSAEMFAEELAIRAISGQSKIDSLKLASGKLDRMDFGKITSALEQSTAWPLWVDDRADMRLVDIQVGARRLVKEEAVKVIFVDYLQLIKEPDGSRNREDAVRRLSDGFKQLAKELGITIVALAQLNRSSERREGRKPVVSDLRDSGAIEQDANVILLLNPQESEADEDAVDVELIVAKCRGGRLGALEFGFNKPTTTFYPKQK